MTHILIPREPNPALLRPFIGCPEGQLPEAWAAMVRAAEVQNARAGRSCLAQIQEPAAVAGPADMRNALRWAAGGLRAVADDNDTLRIGSETRTVGEVLDAANAALEPAAPALEAHAAPAAPNGWKLVPVNPTIAMLLAGDHARISTEHQTKPQAAYAAMLAAAPQAPVMEAQAANDLAQRLRTACLSVRSKSYPLSDLIPLMQQAADALAAAPQAPAELQAAPVVGQCRWKGEKEWSNCSVEHVRMILQNPSEWQSYEARYLYAAPQAPAAPVVKASSTEPVFLEVRAGVRYWEDATVNGVEDERGDLIPLRSGDDWVPTISLADGLIEGWPQGTSADIHYKVCDDGEYFLLNADRQRVRGYEGYVPDMLAVGDNGYGDYIILKVGPTGHIEGWSAPSIDTEEWPLLATTQAAPAAPAVDALAPVQALLDMHAELLDANPYAYFELAYTRQTGWMAWITDKPMYGAQFINHERKVLARGQGDTPAEACAAAARAKEGGAA